MTHVHLSVVPDLLRALTVLQPADDVERASIARLFGIEAAVPVPPEPLKPPTPSPVQPPSQKPPEPDRERTAGPARTPTPLPSEGAPPSKTEEVPSVLVPDCMERRSAPAWLESVDQLPEARR